MAEWTNDALDQYAKRVLLDALRLDWDDSGGTDEDFTPSKRYENEMREMAAAPEAWAKRKSRPSRLTWVSRIAAAIVLALVGLAASGVLGGQLGQDAARITPSVSTPTALAVTLLCIGLLGLLIRRLRKK